MGSKRARSDVAEPSAVAAAAVGIAAPCEAGVKAEARGSGTAKRERMEGALALGAGGAA
jgi:hypothetical protein